MPTKTEPEEVRDSTKAQPENLRDFTEAQAEEARDSFDTVAGESADACCRTHPLVPAFSICLLKKRSCPHVMSFGHQYLCRHPDHAAFLVSSSKPKK
ncbi:hypothetical protein KOM00_11900 [Geomonas sp. Red69]|uniref:Uncharacterized protein n=1 Tax=Geomonas diazotrophica TaxID=2843197 RepID=A0ABX8JHQ3_9BACT|nr:MULTISPECIES: hypothetical protein [Geomonas]MBU5637433.1 hypothetical protein [Geomonas diazotrophica]QWV97900.1 hypothetical protein KP005_00965 [Geomonas nitrogeniifigens]QXE87040.1 hypothetical protein KP003_01110 [Geomonas nitrogeniifigens]